MTGDERPPGDEDRPPEPPPGPPPELPPGPPPVLPATPPQGPPPHPVPPYGPPYSTPPTGRSHTAQFWIGVALALPGLLLLGVVFGAVSALIYQLPTQVASVVSGVFGLVPLALVAAGLIWSRTRWYVLGAVAATAVLLVVLAGLCVAILSSMS